jgi:hypothetical protein
VIIGLSIQATPIDEESDNGADYDAPAPKKKVKETKIIAPKLTVRKVSRTVFYCSH